MSEPQPGRTTNPKRDARMPDVKMPDIPWPPDLPGGDVLLPELLHGLPVGVAVATLDQGAIRYANPAFRAICGGSRPEGFADLGAFLAALGPDAADDLLLIGDDGARRTISVQTISLPGVPLQVVTVQDITEARLAAQALREGQRRYQLMSETSPVGILHIDPQGTCLQVNKRWREITGLSAVAALGRPWYTAVHPDDRDAVLDSWNAAAAQGRAFKVECRCKRQDGATTWVLLQGEPLLDPQDKIEGYLATVTDISRRKRSEEEMRQLAYYDPLTRLPNRPFFLEQLERALATARRTGRRVALLFCDLDNFKDINDSLGHDFGDLLLVAIAERLSACIRRGDTLCRLGGDEFVLLLPWVAADREVLAVADKIQEAMTQSFLLPEHEAYTTTSIGIAVHPDDGADVHTLLKHADMAMYAAKAQGRNRYRFFSEDMNRRTQERLRLEAGLRQAIARKELSLAWQPQFELATGRLVGVEALLRWTSAELGEIGPAQFIPLAEESGLIHTIGAWVLKQACAQARLWRDLGGAPFRVAVNLSGRQFMEPGLIDLVHGTLAETGLQADWLELELTESVLMQDEALAQRTLNSLHDGGVHLAIDDFGTGYSSLLYLKNYPIGRIKIARPFISDITRRRSDAAIAETVIAMANSLSMRAVGEGVETKEQADVLRGLGCHEVQGFYFAPPMTAAEFGRRLD